MVRRSEDGRDDVPRADLTDDVLHEGWKQTVEDMRAMAADRDRRGYETLAIPSANTAPVAPSPGDDRLGFSHLVDRSDGRAFVEHYEGRDFTETGVYQVADSGHVFLVTEHIDLDAETVIYLAGTFRVADAVDLVRAATDRGRLSTYVRKLDRTVLGTFEHDDVTAFFPEPGSYLGYHGGG